MGILDDLAMGFGFKPRTQDYDARTARTIALDERFGIGEDADIMGRSRALANNDYDVTSGQAARFLAGRGAGPNYSPKIITRDQDDRSFAQRALFSPQSDLMSPTPYAIGPMQLDGPLRIPGILGMITGGLFGQQNREIPTVSADGGPTRVRPPLDAGLNRFESQGARSHRAAMAAGYPTPDLSPRDTDYMMDTGPRYTGAKDYALGYGIDSPLLDFRPGTADLMESHIPLASDGEAVEAMTTEDMAGYLRDKGIDTTYMDDLLIKDLYDLQKRME